MTAVVSPDSSPPTPTTPPALTASPAALSPTSADPSSPASAAQQQQQHPALPPLITTSGSTSPPTTRRNNIPRPMSQGSSKHRLSQYSTVSSLPTRSRPGSYVFPCHPSSLPYTSVRDFAYPVTHPLHYGPPPEPTQPPTPAGSEKRRLSDPPAYWESKTSWDEGESSSSWCSSGWFRASAEVPPPINLADGPPWSEDEDLQSPVVSTRHRKHKSGSHGKRRGSADSTTAGTGGLRDSAGANGENGSFTSQTGGSQTASGQAEPQSRTFDGGDWASGDEGNDDSDCSSDEYFNTNSSRYSRDYQFTIASPDEEFHGKAVALFDFERENETELPLVEGQIIWVSYRYGQGWLVAEDPKTQERGLVPEEYVRLLRDIEGGMGSLNAAMSTSADTPDAGTPTQADSAGWSTGSNTSASASASGANGYHQPIVSTFSTSSKDLEPYPHDLLASTTAGQPPPPVVHYHGQPGGGGGGGCGSNSSSSGTSQANTPTLAAYQGSWSRRGSVEAKKRESESVQNGQGKRNSAGSNSTMMGQGAALETLSDARLQVTAGGKREK